MRIEKDNLIILYVNGMNVYESYAKIESFPANLLNTFSYIFFPGLFTSEPDDPEVPSNATANP